MLDRERLPHPIRFHVSNDRDKHLIEALPGCSSAVAMRKSISPICGRFARITSSTRITATRSISGIMHESSRPGCAIRGNPNLPEELTFLQAEEERCGLPRFHSTTL
jgi:hypothetical protein